MVGKLFQASLSPVSLGISARSDYLSIEASRVLTCSQQNNASLKVN